MAGLMRAIVETPLGPMVAVADSSVLRMLEFATPRRVASQVARLERIHDTPVALGESVLFWRLREELAEYFAGRLHAFQTPIETGGTAFQARAWARLRAIPYGETLTYGRLAADLGVTGGSRAVGAANRANPIAILVPCHRVVRGNGDLGGYAGGIEVKRALLELEGAQWQPAMNL